MSDEEKKAIEYVKNIKSWWWDNSPNRIYSINRTDIEQFDIVLNLIERQQKEIEELVKVSKECIEEKFNNDNMWEDKIKAKIEEVEQWELYNMKIPRLSTLDERLGAKIGIKYVLQSLLEKE